MAGEEPMMKIGRYGTLDEITSNDNVVVKQEDGLTAQALMTLHDSVQNMPRKHKTALQEAVHEASPIKKSRLEDDVEIEENVKSEVFFSSPYKLRDYKPKNIDSDQMQEVSNKINNILKQSAGRKWVFHEWFYSNIDKALLLGENEFQSCLRQIFPNLKSRNLTRNQWSMIRRLMGKPRRCSPAFFAEERRSLEEKRKKIRHLHQLKGFEVTDIKQFKDLPEEIPIPMVVGTKVSAKVHPTGNGVRLFTGTIDAIDNINNSYRISFDRKGVDSKSVADIATSSEQYECMNKMLFIVKERPRIAGATSPTDKGLEHNDESKSSPDIRLTNALNDDKAGTYGGFPIKFLLQMTKLSKLVKLKKKYIEKLKLTNDQAEIKHPFNEGFTLEFQKEYAFVILNLEKINKELTSTFESIYSYMSMNAQQLVCYDQRSTLKLECDEIANDMISQSQHIIMNDHLKGLVAKFTSLMLQINKLSDETEPIGGSLDLSLIDESLNEIKLSIKGENKSLFENGIETNIGFIKSGLQNGSSLLATFVKNRNTTNTLEKRLEEIDNGYLSSEGGIDIEEEIDDEEGSESNFDDEQETLYLEGPF